MLRFLRRNLSGPEKRAPARGRLPVQLPPMVHRLPNRYDNLARVPGKISLTTSWLEVLQNCFETEGNSTEERRFSAYLGPSRRWTTQSPVSRLVAGIPAASPPVRSAARSL